MYVQIPCYFIIGLTGAVCENICVAHSEKADINF